MTAYEQYLANRIHTDEQIKMIQKMLKNMDMKAGHNQKDWGFSGSIGHIEELLNEIIEFIRQEGNYETKRIFDFSMDFTAGRSLRNISLGGGFMSNSNAAAELGRKGGAAKTPAKKNASKENGKKGGRPPKKGAKNEKD